jgi:hypothetical protein
MKIINIKFYFFIIFSYFFISICSNVLIRKNLKSVFDYNKKLFKNNFKKITDKFKFKSNSLTVSHDKSMLKNNLKKLSSNMLENIHQGWIKFIEINENSVDIPSHFYKNKVFFLQMSQNNGINTQAKDNIGYVNIPNEDYLFATLSSETLNIYSGRNEPFKKLEKSMSIADLITESSLNPYTGGIENVGDFEEGYCFMIKFINYSRHYIWELCTDTIYEKDKWMKKLIDLNSKSSITNSNFSNNSVNNNSDLNFLPNLSVGVHQPIITNPVLAIHGPSLFTPHTVPVVTTQPVLPPPNIVSNIAPVVDRQEIFQPIHPGIVHVAPTANAFISSPPPSQIVQVVPQGYQIIGVWSPCSKPCGEGVQIRPLDCMDLNFCQGKKFEQRLCNIQACKEEVESHLQKLQRVADGQWEFLGTWSPCSRSCGGGVQSIERKCVSGTCVGETILTQNCNTFVCGQDPKNLVISVTDIFKKDAFEECKLLEGNLMLVVNNQKVLSHVEVNLQNIEIFSQNNPGVPIVLPLSKLLEVRSSHSDPGCMKMVDSTSHQIALCAEAAQCI